MRPPSGSSSMVRLESVGALRDRRLPSATAARSINSLSIPWWDSNVGDDARYAEPNALHRANPRRGNGPWKSRCPARHASRCLFAVAFLLPAFPCSAQTDESPWRASCATSTCHGGIEGRGPAWNHSLSTWMARDPHAGAGSLLRDSDSRAIVERLAAGAADDPVAYDNVLRTRCISCHTSATPEDCQAIGKLDDSLLHRGVNCQSCHGSAGKWLEPHLRIDWSGPEGSSRRPACGIRNRSSVAHRPACDATSARAAKTDLIRDMNHDLIAAGHPALRFDLLIYNDNLPKHWDSESEVGAAVRGIGGSRSSSWPRRQPGGGCLLWHRSALVTTFAIVPRCLGPNYPITIALPVTSRCRFVSTHLPPRATGQMKSPLHVSDGLPVWNSWHTIGNELEIRGNRRALEMLSPHRSDPAQIASLAEQIADRFRQKASDRSAPPLTAAQISQAAQQAIDAVRTQLQQSAPVDWHQAAIQYLELDAAARDLSRSANRESQAGDWPSRSPMIEQMLRFESTDDARKRKADFIRRLTLIPDDFRSKLLNLLDDRTAESRNIRPDRHPTAATDQPASMAQET